MLPLNSNLYVCQKAFYNFTGLKCDYHSKGVSLRVNIREDLR